MKLSVSKKSDRIFTPTPTGTFVHRTIIFMQHEKRKFVRKLDYLTSPGWLDGPDGRENEGLPQGGPESVITNLGIMRFVPKTRRMFLDSCYPGVTPEQILHNMAFTVDITGARQAQSPTAEELRILRERCDPQRLILGG